MALIRKDKHGLYVKSGGCILRPYFPVGYNHVYDDGTQYTEGEKQKANRKGPKLANVGEEIWFNHGTYMGKDNFNSIDCWKIENHDKSNEKNLPIEIRNNILTINKNISNE